MAPRATRTGPSPSRWMVASGEGSLSRGGTLLRGGPGGDRRHRETRSVAQWPGTSRYRGPPTGPGRTPGTGGPNVGEFCTATPPGAWKDASVTSRPRSTALEPAHRRMTFRQPPIAQMVDTESRARAIVGSTSQPIRDALLPDDTVCVGLFLSPQVDRVAPAGERWRTIIGRVLSAAAAASAIIRNRPRTNELTRGEWQTARDAVEGAAQGQSEKHGAGPSSLVLQGLRRVPCPAGAAGLRVRSNVRSGATPALRPHCDRTSRLFAPTNQPASAQRVQDAGTAQGFIPPPSRRDRNEDGGSHHLRRTAANEVGQVGSLSRSSSDLLSRPSPGPKNMLCPLGFALTGLRAAKIRTKVLHATQRCPSVRPSQ